MGFDDASYDNEPPDKAEYLAWERRKARASEMLKQIAAANNGEEAIQPIMVILEQADAKNDLRVELAKKDLQNRELQNQKRTLLAALLIRRADESKHSQEDHECIECMTLADVGLAEKRKCNKEREDGSPCEGFVPCPRHFRERLA